MSLNQDFQATIRRHLLGQLGDASREEFEKRVMTDDELFEQLIAVEDELTDEYVSGELTAAEMELFETHFLVTPERERKLRFARALRNYVSTHPAAAKRRSKTWYWPGFSNPYFRIAAAASLIAVAAIGGWRVFFFQSDVDKALIALNSAYARQRPFESRITDLSYAPFSTTRGSGAETVDHNELSRAELQLLEAVHNNPTPEVHHALGKVYLTKKEFDKAIGFFDKAAKADPDNAQIFADLGTAWLEKGRSSSSERPDSEKPLEDFARSLENLSKALQLQNNLPEALFNRALVLEEQKLWGQAEEAWDQYLHHDSSSEWAQEAKRKLSELQQRKQSVQRSDTRLVDDFLAAYKQGDEDRSWKISRESYTSGGSIITKQLVKSILELPDDREVERNLNTQALSYLGQLELERAEDAYHSDLARFYSFLPAAKRKAVKKLRGQVEQALQYSSKARTGDAIHLFLTSKQEWESLGNSAEASFVAYQLAQSYAIQPNLKKGQEIYNDLSEQCKNRKYQWLTGQALVGLAHISVAQNQYSQAIDLSKAGLSVFERAGYADGIVKALRQLAELYHSVNGITQSLKLLSRSLTVAEGHHIDPLGRWGIYLTIAFDLDSLGLLSAAAAYQREALGMALEMQLPLITSRSYAFLGATQAKLKNFPEAIANLKQAYETGARVADDPNGQEMMANSSLQLGDLYRAANDPTRAIESYDTCLRLYDKLRMPYFNYEAHRGKLLTYIALQDDSATERELNITMAALEDYRTGINESSQRNSFFANQQLVYDLAIDFSYSRKHDSQMAFKYSEDSRARTLLETLQQSGTLQRASTPELRFSSVSKSLPLTSIQSSMSPDSQIVQYALLDQRSLVWVISTDDFQVREIPVGKSELTGKVNNYLRLITTSSGDRLKAEMAAEDLHQLLIGPVESLLSKQKIITVVPDKILNYLPFAALRSPHSKRFFLENYNIQLSPSASVFIYSSRTALTKESRDAETLLSIGNPSFDREAFSDLKDLPSAGREAESIGAFYKSPNVLLGKNAREGSFKILVNNADVVHMALHHVLNDKSEMLSALALAKEPRPRGDLEGRVHAYEIYQMSLPRTRLAVLSACQTGIDRNFDGEGAVSMARPFMVAGVPLVVATLWPVESNSTAELMVRFHRYRTIGSRSTVEALRLAQLDLVHQSREYAQPYHWAPFVVIGGHASF